MLPLPFVSPRVIRDNGQSTYAFNQSIEEEILASAAQHESVYKAACAKNFLFLYRIQVLKYKG